MKNTNYIIRTINGKRYGFKATRVILNGNDYSQKVYDFGTEWFPSGERIMVRVFDNATKKMRNEKLARCLMIEAIVTDLDTNTEFVWNGSTRVFG
jgi:hypothetical protein